MKILGIDLDKVDDEWEATVVTTSWGKAHVNTYVSGEGIVWRDSETGKQPEWPLPRLLEDRVWVEERKPPKTDRQRLVGMLIDSRISHVEAKGHIEVVDLGYPTHHTRIEFNEHGDMMSWEVYES